MDLILYAIPFFFLAILLELAYGLAAKNNTYRVNDTINSLSMGSISRLQGLVVLGFSASLFELIAREFQLRQLADNEAWVWISCFALYDFSYYWKHRLGHEIAIFWGSHVAHHQSEDYNLGTALRQTSIDFYGFLFYLPFFLLGFPAEVLFTVVSLNLIYQFWVHTQHVPKLGVLEWVFITPSNHRVHHARNKIYVDKNYGGVFILWDRFFGSFQEELDDEEVIFGLRKPLNSWNPLWANIHVYYRLIQDFLKAPGIGNKIKTLFKAPGWQPQGMKSACKLRQQSVDLTARFDPAISGFNRAYTFIQFLLTVALSLVILINAGTIGYSITTVFVILLTYSLYVHGAWLEAKSYAPALEIFRLLLLIASLLLNDFNALLSNSLLSCAVISLIIVVTAGRKNVGIVSAAQP